MELSPEEATPRGLTRERLVMAALALVNDEGLDSLSMRALADRLDVKAASLYWHVRDRRELLELLAESILDGVRRPRRAGGWRPSLVGLSASLGRRISEQKDAGRILLEVPESLRRSDVFRDMTSQMTGAGLQAAEAREVALMVMTHVIAMRSGDEPAPLDEVGARASIAIDSGSRGVVLRAGPPDMQALFRVPPEQRGAAPAVVRGEQVVVRRLRGVGRGEIELNPGRRWDVKVQGPTWNTVLDLGGLDVGGIHLDSGAANLECFLAQPHGLVPIQVSGGVVNVVIHRPQDVSVVALAHTGVVKLKLDDYSAKVTVLDVHWQTPEAAQARDRYQLDVSGGAVNLRLDTYRPKAPPARARQTEPVIKGMPATALEILLDGVEARIRARR